jgi:hypothetical protein
MILYLIAYIKVLLKIKVTEYPSLSQNNLEIGIKFAYKHIDHFYR